MATMQWNSQLVTGHPEIDRDHQTLVSLLNKLGEAMRTGSTKTVCGSVLNDLLQYTKTHFTMEERLMATHGYKDATAHKQEHEAFIHDVVAFKEKFDAGTGSISVALIYMLRDWLSTHIQKSDKAFVAAIASGRKTAKAVA